jgi:recombinational DNA repair protein (RecF pathway)
MGKWLEERFWMAEKSCAKCGVTVPAGWYGVTLSDGSHGVLCEPCYKVEKKEYEEWLANASGAEKRAHRDELLRAAGIQ